MALVESWRTRLPEPARGAVRYVVTDQSGRAFVVRPRTVDVLDSSGQWLASFPAAIANRATAQTVVGAGLLSDSLWIGEENNVTHLFAPDGALVRSETVPGILMGERRVSRILHRRLADGTAIVEGLLTADPALHELHMQMVRIDRAGNILNPLATRPITRTGRIAMTLLDEADEWIPGDPDTLASIGSSVDGARVAVVTPTFAGDSARLAILMRGAAGDTTYEASVIIAAHALDRLRADSAIAAAVAAAPKRESVLRSQGIPAHYPPVQSLWVARDGRLLIACHALGAVRPLVVLDPAGRVERVDSIPRDAQIKRFEGMSLWVVYADSASDAVARLRFEPH